MILYLSRESVDGLTTEQIKKFVTENSTDTRLLALKNYYEFKHKILSRMMRDSKTPNNKLIHSYPKYITDTATGYFMGVPVSYSTDDKGLNDDLQKLMKKNKEPKKNYQLAKEASKYGYVFELVYLNENADVRFCAILPHNGVMIYDASVEPKVLAFIRHYENTVLKPDGTQENEVRIELYREMTVETYLLKNGAISQTTDDANSENKFKAVPVVEYKNNEERIGDYEPVLSLVDAYDLVRSNSANLFQYNDDALLKFKGCTADYDQITEMKEKGCVMVDGENADIGWLLKDINDAALENHKNQLQKDIHELSYVPNLTDEQFAGNLSGVAIKFKIWALEQLAGIKERSFQEALEQRLILVSKIMAFKGGNPDIDSIKISFTRNLPANLVELVQAVRDLRGSVSLKTLLSLLPFILDPEAELKEMEKEENKKPANSLLGSGPPQGDIDGQ